MLRLSAAPGEYVEEQPFLLVSWAGILGHHFLHIFEVQVGLMMIGVMPMPILMMRAQGIVVLVRIQKEEWR